MFDFAPTRALLSLLTDSAAPVRMRFGPATPAFLAMVRGFGVQPGRWNRCLRSVESSGKGAPLRAAERRLVLHLAQMRRRRVQLDRMLTRLDRLQEGIHRRALRRARRFLPRPAGLTDARVAVVPLPFDARVDGLTVYFDPLLALAVGPQGVEKLLAHEFHHIGRYQITGDNITSLRPARTDRLTDSARLARWWVSLLEMEGVADCVFDLASFGLPVHRSMRAARRSTERHFSTIMEEIEKAILSVGTGSRVSAFRDRAVGLAAPHVHALGAHIARLIQARRGLRRLRACVGSPARFAREFNLAAHGSGEFEFGVRMLDELGSS